MTANTPDLRSLDPARIIVRGVNWLGDAVMTSPALMRLRERFSHAHITLFTDEKLAGVWEEHPALNAVRTFSGQDSVWSAARVIRSGKFDLALVLPNSPRSALEAWLAGVPRRVGYRRSWRNFFLTDPITPRPEEIAMRKLSLPEILNRNESSSSPDRPLPSPRAHHLFQYLHLVAALGGRDEAIAPLLTVSDPEICRIREKFGIGRDHPWFGLNPGAEYGPAKRWPAERFAQVVRQCQIRGKIGWILFGGRNDAELADQVQKHLKSEEGPVVNLAGRTSLRELCAALKCCQVLLTNDTGPMHVAAALDVPVVVPFGSTSGDLTGPGLPGDSKHRLLKSKVACSPCFLRECPIDFRCMNGISVERVMQAISEVSRIPI